MANTNASSQKASQGLNGASKVDPHADSLESLRAEIVGMRQALAHAEAERDRYLQAIYADERARLQVEDVDFAELERTSAGPVELME